jgi:hypothetical protein
VVFKQIIADKPCDIRINKLKAYSAARKISPKGGLSGLLFQLLHYFFSKHILKTMKELCQH